MWRDLYVSEKLRELDGERVRDPFPYDPARPAASGGGVAAVAGRILMRAGRRLGARAALPSVPHGSALTQEERRILGLVAQGRTSPQVAAHLDLSEKTVKEHMTNIIVKLHHGNSGQPALELPVGAGAS